MYTNFGKKRLRVYQSGDKFFIYRRIKEPIQAQNVVFNTDALPKRRNKSQEKIQELKQDLLNEKKEYENKKREYEKRYQEMLRKTERSDPESAEIIEELRQTINDQRQNAERCQEIEERLRSQDSSDQSQEQDNNFDQCHDQLENNSREQQILTSQLLTLNQEMENLRNQYTAKDTQLKSQNKEFKIFSEINEQTLREKDSQIKKMESEYGMTIQKYANDINTCESNLNTCNLTNQECYTQLGNLQHVNNDCEERLRNERNESEKLWNTRHANLISISNKMKEDMARLFTRNQELEEENQEKDAETNREIQGFVDIIKKLNTKIDENQEQIRKLEKTYDQDVESNKAEIERLKNDTLEKKEKIETQEEKLDMYERNLESSRNETRQKSDQLELQAETLQKIDEDNDYTERILKQYKSRNLNSEKTINELKQEKEEQGKEITSYRKKIDELEEKIHSNNGSLDILTEKYDKARQKIAQYDERLVDLGEREDQQTILKEKLSNAEAKALKYTELSALIERENKELYAQIDVISDNHGALLDKYAKLTQKMTETEDHHRELQQRHRELKLSSEKLHKIIEDLRSENESDKFNYTQQFNTLHAHTEGLLEKIRELEMYNDQKDTMYSELVIRHQHLQSKIQELEDNEQECQKILEQNIKLQSDNEELAKNLRMMKLQLNSQQETVQNVMALVQDVREDKSTNASLYKIIDDLQKRLNNADQEILVCETFMQENADLLRENSQLRQKLNERID